MLLKGINSHYYGVNAGHPRVILEDTQTSVNNLGNHPNMEGPPLRSATIAVTNMDCLCGEKERMDQKDVVGRKIVDGKDNDDTNVYAIFGIQSLPADNGCHGSNANDHDEEKAMEALCADEVAGDADVYDIHSPTATRAVYEYRGSNTDHEDIFIGLFSDADNNSRNDDGSPEDITQRDDLSENDEDAVANRVIASIQAQAQNHVFDCAEGFQKLKAAVDKANETLSKFSKPGDKITDELMEDMESFLTNTPRWYLSVLKEQDKSIEALNREVYDVQEQNNSLLLEREEFQAKLQQCSKSLGLSASDQRKMKSLGVNSLSQLINEFAQLQVQTLGQTQRKMSRCDSVSTFDSSVKWPLQQKTTKPMERLQQDYSIMPITAGDCPRLCCSVIIPPVGVFFQLGCTYHLALCILLTLLGYIPGLIYAIYIIVEY